MTLAVLFTTSKQCFELTSSVLSTTSKHCFEQPAASFLVCSLIFIEYKTKEHLSGMNIQRGVFLGFLSDLTLFLENDSLYKHGVIFRLFHKL